MIARPMISEPTLLERADVFANGWVGVRFAYDGRDMGGTDCWGLVWRFHRDVLAIDLPDWVKGDHGRGWVRGVFADQYADHWERLAEPEQGCIALVLPGVGPAHAGVFHRGGVLHADDPAGVVWHPLARFMLKHPGAEFGRYRAEANW